MKTVVKNQFAALFVAALAFTLAFSNCKGGSNNSNENQFNIEDGLAGTTWVAETDYANYLLSFEESTYEWTDLESGELIDSGNYTIEGSSIHLVRQGGDWTDTFTLNGEELSIGENEDYKLFVRTVG